MKGIPFRPDMILAIREGRKTQTRREIKPQPDKYVVRYVAHGDEFLPKVLRENAETGQTEEYVWTDLKKRIKPRYHVGEVVYIKEAHYAYGKWKQFHESGKSHWKFFRQPDTVIHFADGIDWMHALTKSSAKAAWYKRSPMFLEERFARDFLEITAVRPERLQDITEDGARAEGCPNFGALAPREEALAAIIELEGCKPPYRWQKQALDKLIAVMWPSRELPAQGRE